jgi:hypothetical protein
MSAWDHATCSRNSNDDTDIDSRPRNEPVVDAHDRDGMLLASGRSLTHSFNNKQNHHHQQQQQQQTTTTTTTNNSSNNNNNHNHNNNNHHHHHNNKQARWTAKVQTRSACCSASVACWTR